MFSDRSGFECFLQSEHTFLGLVIKTQTTSFDDISFAIWKNYHNYLVSYYKIKIVLLFLFVVAPSVSWNQSELWAITWEKN